MKKIRHSGHFIMWNPFRRKPAEAPFPKPKWPPIQGLDRIDIICKLDDGGVDLIICATQPIDNSPETLETIRHKVNAYITLIEQFQPEMGHPPREKTTIVIGCDHPIHPQALAVIAQCQKNAAAKGVRLELRKSPQPK